jgi:hemerythrin-like domain-containing protein
MQNNRITELMVAQHALLDTLFVAFKDEMGTSPEKAKVFFDEFAREMKKHFFVEEQAIFNLLVLGNGEVDDIVGRLKKEHATMLQILEKGPEGPNEGFSILLKNHVELEEKKLYPALDEKLNDDEKALIVSRINQVPFGK